MAPPPALYVPRGSFLDLLGGRTPHTRLFPTATDAQARRAVRWMRFSSTNFWPTCRPEDIGARLKRIVGAFFRIGDLF